MYNYREIILESSINLCNSMINNMDTLLSRKLMQNTTFFTTYQRGIYLEKYF